MKLNIGSPIWTAVAPLAGCAVYLLGDAAGTAYYYLAAIAIVAVVLSAVHHAEVIAHKVGEPFGTLILAIAITIIEVSLIVTIMLAGGEGAAELARDTVFAAVMILITGIIGLSLMIGGFRYTEQKFGRHAVGASLVTLTAISVLTLILPNYTTTKLGPVYSNGQLIFIAIVSLILYGTFIAIQTGRHRDYFLSDEDAGHEQEHSAPPARYQALISLLLLIISLGAVVILAKSLAPFLERTVESVGAPKSLVGVIIALVILLPEGLAALKAANHNRLQASLNLALGSALASIGLTIPTVAVVSMATGMSVTLGIDTKSTLLLVLALFTNMLSFGTGRTNILQGVVLLVIFAVYLFMTIVP